MSRIRLNRLENQRKYKMLQRETMGTEKIVSGLSPDYLSIRGLTKSDIIEKMNKMYSCADRVEALDCGVDENGETMINVLRANWCKVTSVCAICSARLQGRRHEVYKKPISDFCKKYKYRYMITFTVKDGLDLSERLDHLRVSFRRWYLMGQRRVAGGRSGGESGKLAAALAGVELLKTDCGRWHCHIHSLVFTDEKINYRVYDQAKKDEVEKRLCRSASAAELRSCVSTWGVVDGVKVPVSKLTAEWLAVSGDSVNVDCRPLRGGWYDIQKQALEVLKYSSKLASVSSGSVPAGADLVDLVASTHGRRLFSALRGFRGLVTRKTEYDDPGKPDYTIVWDYAAGEYMPVSPGRDIEIARSETQSLAGRLVGQWRRDRRSMLDHREIPGCSGRLDHIKRLYREVIKQVYRGGVRVSFVESMRRVVLLLPEPVDPIPVQLSLFTT